MFESLPASRREPGGTVMPAPFAHGADDAARQAHAVRPHRLRVHVESDPHRGEVEACIRAVYAERHGALVRGFAPTLVSLHDGQRIVAAAGYRFADQPLFLERYLDAPVEVLLAALTGAEAPAREGIVEVGHLAAVQAGAGRSLVGVLGLHLATLGAQWVASTLTQELRGTFLRMGVEPLVLGTAHPERLGDEARDWGRYYEHNPVVLAGHLPAALRRMAAGSTRARGGVA